MDFNFEYRVNDKLEFVCASCTGSEIRPFVGFKLFNSRELFTIAYIGWTFDTDQELNDFMVKFVRENFENGYKRGWQMDEKIIALESYIRSDDASMDFGILQRDCFPKLKEALTKHYCPELLQDHIPDDTKMVNEEIVLNGVKYRRVE